MANDINQVVLIGRLTRDAELKYTNSGTAVSHLGLAVNRRRKVGDNWTDEASFFDVVVWGRSAESLNQYLTKGKQIGVMGELRQNRWEQDGQNRSRVEIVANNIQLLGGSGGGAPRQSGGYGGSSYDAAPNNYRPDNTPVDNGPSGNFPDEFEDDNIPF